MSILGSIDLNRVFYVWSGFSNSSQNKKRVDVKSGIVISLILLAIFLSLILHLPFNIFWWSALLLSATLSGLLMALGQEKAAQMYATTSSLHRQEWQQQVESLERQSKKEQLSYQQEKSTLASALERVEREKWEAQTRSAQESQSAKVHSQELATKIAFLQGELKTVQMQQEQERVDQHGVVESLQQERSTLVQQGEMLSLQLTEKSAALEKALKDTRCAEEQSAGMQDALARVQAECCKAEEEMRHLDQRSEQLRAQLDQKTVALQQIRKDFFDLEGKYVVLHKQWENASCEPESAVGSMIKQLDGEYNDLGDQVLMLQEIVTELSQPKKITRVRKQKVKREIQESLF
jgi:chromosome segregation ATPase